jgi:hypothetical protein
MRPRAARTTAGAAQRALLRAVLEHAGVRPAVEVRDGAGQSLGRARIARYRFGGREVVAILEENLDVATLYGRDGVTVYEDSNRGRLARQEVVVHLPRAATVTNVRTGADLGRTDAARVTLTPATPSSCHWAKAAPRSRSPVPRRPGAGRRCLRAGWRGQRPSHRPGPRLRSGRAIPAGVCA